MGLCNLCLFLAYFPSVCFVLFQCVGFYYYYSTLFYLLLFCFLLLSLEACFLIKRQRECGRGEELGGVEGRGNSNQTILRVGEKLLSIKEKKDNKR